MDGSSGINAEYGGTVYYQKILEPKSQEWQYMSNFFFDFMETSTNLEIKEVYAIFNETLLNSFVSQFRILSSRLKSNPKLFNKSDWKMSDDAQARSNVYDFYKSRAEVFPWNRDSALVILPTLHGTDFGIALNIASSGFAILSSLDAGWYGKGVYFTTFTKYCIPYFSKRQDPAVIISFVIMGNTYPVIENPKESGKTFLGAALKSGYNSHYVVVNTEGLPTSMEKKIKFFDEVVVPQEAQIVPLYIVRMVSFDSKKVLKQWDVDKRKSNRNAL
eukprot:TRINITY_DN7142_c0_g2_i3.p1 TRINITY_DN7142_c0_g2~~TRINITY_DN7142_c0_g2_i3.p1  ORF type:complete len:274 (-),score=74.82 TRINITY_DN7142_c0_g2_i3:149-970(-)